MSKKALVVLLLVAGLVVYSAYIYSIMRPYFAQVELDIAWELEYEPEPFDYLHIGSGGTIFLVSQDYEFVGISPKGRELFRFSIPNPGYGYGYDEGTNDTLWVATVDSVDPSFLPQNGLYVVPPSSVENPASSEDAPSVPSPYTGRIFGTPTDSSLKVDETFEASGTIGNLWCMDGMIYFMDSGQNLSCFDESGNRLWEKYIPTMVDFSKGNGMLFLNCGTDVVGLNPEGNELWKLPIGQGGGLARWTNWRTANDRLCLLDNNDFIHVISSDGVEIWSYELPFSYGSFGGYGYADTSVAIHSDNTVYALSQDAILRRFSPDGNILWQFNVGGYPSKFDVGEDGTVYIRSNSRGLLAISSEGKLLWRDISIDETYYSPKVGQDGLLYMLRNHKLIAFELPGS